VDWRIGATPKPGPFIFFQTNKTTVIKPYQPRRAPPIRSGTGNISGPKRRKEAPIWGLEGPIGLRAHASPT